MLYVFAAAILAAAMMLALMPTCIMKLKKLKFGQTMYELGPQSHLNKKGTPNMGGIVTGPVTTICTVLLTVALYVSDPVKGFWGLGNWLWGLLFVALGSMAVGFTDDYIKDVKKNHEGLRPKQKIAGPQPAGLRSFA